MSIWYSVYPVEIVRRLKDFGSNKDLLDREKFLSGVVELDLSRSKLAGVPDFIKDCKNLKSLDLSYNYIKEIGCSDFPESLEELDLTDNKITNFSAEGFSEKQLKNIFGLYLGENDLTKIPEGIERNFGLKILSLEGNKISLDSSTRFPKNLATLNLSRNNITDFKFEEFSECTFLDISENPMDVFPVELLEIKNLKIVYARKIEFKNWEFLSTSLSKGISIYT